MSPNTNTNTHVRRSMTGLLVAALALFGVLVLPQAASAADAPYPDTVLSTVAVDVSGGSHTLAASPDGTRLYVVGSGAPGEVSVIDTATRTVVDTITFSRPNGTFLNSVAVSADGTRLYVSQWSNSFGTGAVFVVDTSTAAVIGTIPVSGTTPGSLAVSPDGSRVYVITSSSAVTVIDTATSSIAGAIAAPGSPADVVVSPDGATVYITTSGGQTVLVVDAATNSVTATVPFGRYPSNVVASPDGARLYIGNPIDGTVGVFDTATNTVVDTLTVGDTPAGLAMSLDGRFVYVANSQGTPSVSVIDTAAGAVIDTLSTGGRPTALAVSPDGNYVYASDAPSGVTVLARAFTVSFDLNGASGAAPADQIVAYGETATEPAAPSRSGYTFAGWSETPDGSTGVFAFTTPITSGPTTLYALWTQVTVVHTVTFDANGGVGSMADQSASAPTALTSNAFTRDGFTFTGWNTRADGTGAAYADGATYAFDTDVTMYAQWTQSVTPSPTPDPGGGPLAASGLGSVWPGTLGGTAALLGGLGLLLVALMRNRRHS